jgi:hypothetical protein
MGRTEARADFSGALSAIVVAALLLATTAMMLVTLNSKAGAVAELGLTEAQHVQAQVSTGTVVAVARPADGR